MGHPSSFTQLYVTVQFILLLFFSVPLRHTSTRPYDRARWRHLARRLTLGVAPSPLLSAGPGILQVVLRADACKAPRSASGRPAAVLQPVCPSRRTQGVRTVPRAAAQAQMVCLRKAPV